MNAAAASQQTASETHGGAFGDGVPVWMAELGLHKSEWLNLSKAQLRAMQEPGKPLKVQVWATGMLHSPGYKGQEAFRMRNNKKVPLTSRDIIDELIAVAKRHYEGAGIHPTEEQLARLRKKKEEIRRTLSDRSEEHTSQRTDAKGTPLRELSPNQSRRLSSGRTRTFFWLVPRPPT